MYKSEPVKSEKSEKSKDIDSVEIKRAENGFIYCPRSSDGPYSEEKYIYKNLEEALEAIREDFGSPAPKEKSQSKSDTPILVESKASMISAVGKKNVKPNSKGRLFV